MKSLIYFLDKRTTANASSCTLNIQKQDPNLIRKAKSERHKFGVFYYRFPNGEAASDVYERVSTFLDSLWRSFDVKRSNNYVLVTHGISIRVLLARYFRYSIDQFNMLVSAEKYGWGR